MTTVADINEIILAIDEFLEMNAQNSASPVDVNPYLVRKGLLNESLDTSAGQLKKILKNRLIPHAYQVGSLWVIPHSKKRFSNLLTVMSKVEKDKSPSLLLNGNHHKLAPIGKLICELLKEKYKRKAVCKYDFSPDWLLSYPTMAVIEKYPEICELYARLVENKIHLVRRISKLSATFRLKKQSFDIWIGKPFHFAVEFDEKQHFNQFRNITLDFYDRFEVRFSVGYYKSLNNDAIIPPGNSRFSKLKSYDPLFPGMLEGSKQDNRIRQRAFRDFLKDLLPVENGFYPTLRIPYQITHGSIIDFTSSDLQNIKDYINNHDLLSFEIPGSA
jgi:hypothetical protein